jgi:hypothetical protein
MRKLPPVSLVCAYSECKQTFELTGSLVRARTSRGKSIDSLCCCTSHANLWVAQAGISKPRRRKPRPISVCLHCRREFPITRGSIGTFCSRSCVASYRYERGESGWGSQAWRENYVYVASPETIARREERKRRLEIREWRRREIREPIPKATQAEIDHWNAVLKGAGLAEGRGVGRCDYGWSENSSNVLAKGVNADSAMPLRNQNYASALTNANLFFQSKDLFFGY